MSAAIQNIAPGRGIRESGLKGNAAAVVCARLLVPLLNIALVVLLARTQGAAALGAYTLIVTLYQLCENLKSYGLTTMLVRDVAQRPELATRYHAALVRIGYWGSIWTAVLLAAVMLKSSGVSLSIVISTLIMCAGLLPSAHVLANDALFLALNRAKLSLYIALLENTVRLAASLAVLWIFHGGLAELAAIYAVTRLLAAVAGGRTLRRLQLGPAVQDPALRRKMLASALPFLSVFIAPIVLFRIDVVLLGLLAGDRATGVYSAALRLVTVALIVPDGVMTAVFPVLSRLAAQNDPLALRRMVEHVLRLSVAGMTALAAIGYLASSLALHLLFGKNFAASIPVLQILIWMPVFFTSSRVLGDALVASGRQASVGRIVVAALCVSPFLYVPLIRAFGSSGAAYALLLSAVLLFALSAARAVIPAGRFFKTARPAMPIVTLKSLAVILFPALAGAAVIVFPHYSILNWAALTGAVLLAVSGLRYQNRPRTLEPSLSTAA